MTRCKLVKIDFKMTELAYTLIDTLNELNYWIEYEDKHLELFRAAYAKNPTDELLNEYERTLEYYLELMDESDEVSARLEEIGAVITYQ